MTYQCRSCHLCAGESRACTHSSKIQRCSHICAGSPRCGSGTRLHLQKNRGERKKVQRSGHDGSGGWDCSSSVDRLQTGGMNAEGTRLPFITFNQSSYLRDFKDKRATREGKKSILFVNQHKPSFILFTSRRSLLPFAQRLGIY